ncbi:hypothetical protein NUW54_g4354 [Trametes sanguinea]|uniref:Uncharacterized protein n=1 Tax=Trametes sanguinea TaxID=158606 RepID=A0ACC1PYA7_9APHY|nr:hypothetical protein NUW54_g4354 [Trametes sanguinea]
MSNALVFLVFALAIFPPRAHCLHSDWLRRFTPGSRDDSSWLWSWAWAADGTVSVVDRSPPITFPARPASFGAELNDPLLGYVIPLSSFTAPCPYDPGNSTSRRHRFEPDPVFGCPELCVSGSNEPEPTDTWIALVQRGGCPFVEKARQAQKLGAKAVVVGGDRDNPDALLNMFSEKDASDVTIAATYIKYWDYVQLSAMIAVSNTTHSGLKTLSLLISTEYSAWEWYSQDLERGLDTPNASTSHDVALPAWVEQQLECAICLEMFGKGDRVRVLPCYHLFHIDEIDEWLINKKKLCPICKADVTQPRRSPAEHHAAEHAPQADPAASTSSRSPSTVAEPTERTPLLQGPERTSDGPQSAS